jgi:hypothetical protein
VEENCDRNSRIDVTDREIGDGLTIGGVDVNKMGDKCNEPDEDDEDDDAEAKEEEAVE